MPKQSVASLEEKARKFANKQKRKPRPTTKIISIKDGLDAILKKHVKNKPCKGIKRTEAKIVEGELIRILLKNGGILSYKEIEERVTCPPAFLRRQLRKVAVEQTMWKLKDI